MRFGWYWQIKNNGKQGQRLCCDAVNDAFNHQALLERRCPCFLLIQR